ncbi:hypothetical protein F4809DRAFT_642219 [Biscogniauxia mediterranea]|nr:hypothetical protein F4809DRAFT_642219 [Biscogniauxia mediterranea]
MKVSSVTYILAAAGSVVAMPSAEKNTRSVGDVVPSLKRDASGMGFTHVGSDNVVRSFDSRFNVIDFAQLDSRAPSGDWPRTPSKAVLEEAKRARSNSEAQTSNPRTRGVLENRQQPSCVSEFCPYDSYCQGLTIYGYNCTSCLMVTETIGNCQTF